MAGFAFDFSILPAGKRHIFDFYGPGAICNWVRPERADRPETIMFKARSEVCVLDGGRVADVIAENENIARALHGHEVRRAMRVSQRVRALISLPAKECLRSLLLDLDDEYALVDGTVFDPWLDEGFMLKSISRSWIWHRRQLREWADSWDELFAGRQRPPRAGNAA